MTWPFECPGSIGPSDRATRSIVGFPDSARSCRCPIPAPFAKGEPAEGYPWSWFVYRWLEGETATLDRLADAREAATKLARFVTALWTIDPAGGPVVGAHSFFRGVPLVQRDAPTRAAIAALEGMLDTNAVTAAWEAALAAPVWDRAPAWVHGDLQPGNLLAVQGRLSAVIGFGGLGIGDPACDLIVAWNLLTAEIRQVYRAAVAVDEATWARGWALSTGLIALPYYRHRNPVLAGIARRTIDEVIAEHSQPT